MPFNPTMTSILLLFVVLLGLLSSSNALKHSFAVKKDSRLFIAPIGAPFGFLQGGCFGIDVFDFKLDIKNKKKQDDKKEIGLEQLQAGLLLKRFKTESEFATYHEAIQENATACIFQSFLGKEKSKKLNAGEDGIYIPLETQPKGNATSIMYTFQQGEEGLYFLMYQVCLKDNSKSNTKLVKNTKIRSTFEIDFHYRNYDYFGNENYLPAGETQLPHVFLYFTISYAILLGLWVSNIRKIQAGKMDVPGQGRPTIYPIHQLMTVLLILKVSTLFFESVRYHYIRVSGHAQLWSVVYYTLAFLKGTFLFTVILLIGSGWSFVKPFLSSREKKIICLVLCLQVVDNIALVVLSHEAEGERAYQDWSAILHLVDILCCCAVLVPLVWQVNALEKSLQGASSEGENDEALASTVENMRTLDKLKLFRSFYLTVVAYIYFTRILIYLFATMLDYRHTWVRYFLVELATLLFYFVTGLRFRPMNENPYLTVNNKEEESTTTTTTPMMEVEPEIELETVREEGVNDS